MALRDCYNFGMYSRLRFLDAMKSGGPWWLLAVLAMAVAEAEARMYHWVNPATGTAQLSGKPPSWYRGVEGGPRIQVFERGRLLDDTAFPMSPDRSEALRLEAFREFEERNELQALKKLEQAAQREANRKERESAAQEEAAPGEQQGPAEQDVDKLKALLAEFDRRNPEASPPATEPPSAELLKSIIEEWDRRTANQ